MWAVIRPVQAAAEDSEATAQCELFLTEPNRNILRTAYLLTYKVGNLPSKFGHGLWVLELFAMYAMDSAVA